LDCPKLWKIAKLFHMKWQLQLAGHLRKLFSTSPMLICPRAMCYRRGLSKLFFPVCKSPYKIKAEYSSHGTLPQFCRLHKLKGQVVTCQKLQKCSKKRIAELSCSLNTRPATQKKQATIAPNCSPGNKRKPQEVAHNLDTKRICVAQIWKRLLPKILLWMRKLNWMNIAQTISSVETPRGCQEN
jgi:hypothetical protein